MKAAFLNKLPKKNLINGYYLQIANSILISALSVIILKVSSSFLLPTPALTDKLIPPVQTTAQEEKIQIVEAPAFDISTNTGKYTSYGISVDGKIVGELSTFKEAKELLEKIKNASTLQSDNIQVESVEFKEIVKIQELCSNFPRISDSTTLLNYILNGTENIVEYTVVEGDNYWNIAKENNLTVDELLANNPQLSLSTLMPGDKVNITKINPLITTIVSYYTTCEEFVAYGSDIKYVSYMYDNQKKVEKPGTEGVDEVKYLVTEEGGIQLSMEEIERTTLSYPINEIVLVGTQASPILIGNGIFIDPLPEGQITSRFGPRWGTIHTGTDFAMAFGSDIQAADKGVVVFVGYRGSYGYLVDIDHGNGWTTRYAHCNDIYVSVGDEVAQGQIIASVGMTGYTTGPHLHFEVRHYGVALDPLQYLGTYYAD